MKYLLDSNICIHFFRGKFGIVDKFVEIGLENCAISEITYAELVFGAEKSNDPKKNYEIIETFVRQITVLPIYDAILQYAKEKARLQKIGRTVSDFDLLIGCTAVTNDMIMVTENLKDFEKLEEIQIENWVRR